MSAEKRCGASLPTGSREMSQRMPSRDGLEDSVSLFVVPGATSPLLTCGPDQVG